MRTRPRPRKKSDRDLTPEQRRRELIDLLGSAAARMPAAPMIPRCDHPRSYIASDGKDLRAAVSKSHDFTSAARTRDSGHASPREKPSESDQTRLDVSAEMPLSVSTG